MIRIRIFAVIVAVCFLPLLIHGGAYSETWITDLIDPVSPFDCVSSSMVLDGSGFPHIAYLELVTEDMYRLKYARFNGNTWDIQFVNQYRKHGSRVSIAIDQFQQVYICYTGEIGDESYIGLWIYDGSHWRHEKVHKYIYTVTFHANYFDIGSKALVIDAHNQPNIVFSDNHNIFHAYRPAYCIGDCWTIAQLNTIFEQSTVWYPAPKVELSRDGIGILFYVRFLNDVSLRFATKNENGEGYYQTPVLDKSDFGVIGQNSPFDFVYTRKSDTYYNLDVFINRIYSLSGDYYRQTLLLRTYLPRYFLIEKEIITLYEENAVSGVEWPTNPDLSIDSNGNPNVSCIRLNNSIPFDLGNLGKVDDTYQWETITSDISDERNSISTAIDTDSNVSHVSFISADKQLTYMRKCTDSDYGDGFCEGYNDNCPDYFNPEQVDSDGDGIGNSCDNCPYKSNIDQTNSGDDGYGDVCDNCKYTTNWGQSDADADGAGDACDNCSEIPNGPLLGTCTIDREKTCNFAATTPCKSNCNYEKILCEVNCIAQDPSNFWLTCAPECQSQFETCAIACDCGGGWCDTKQTDCDNNGIGNACDPKPCPVVGFRIVDIDDEINQNETREYPHVIPCPNGSCFGQLISLVWPGSEMELSLIKPDGTLFKRVSSTKPIDISIPNDATTDGTWMMEVKAIDVPHDDYAFNLYGISMTCPNDPLMDVDRDGICGDVDNCPDDYNTGQSDIDNDGTGDACDNCPEHYNPEQFDRNTNGMGDACEPLAVSMDIYLGVTINVLITTETAAMAVVVAGSEDLDVESIDLETLTLAGVAPLPKPGPSIADVTCPNCIEGYIVPDGYPDLILQFSIQAILTALESLSGPLETGQKFSLQLKGSFIPSHTPSELTATDSVEIWVGHDCKGDYHPNDGDVDGADLAMFATAFASGNLEADLNNDIIVNAGDVEIFVANYGLNDCWH